VAGRLAVTLNEAAIAASVAGLGIVSTSGRAARCQQGVQLHIHEQNLGSGAARRAGSSPASRTFKPSNTESVNRMSSGSAITVNGRSLETPGVKEIR
jgi:hypothetical protein